MKPDSVGFALLRPGPGLCTIADPPRRLYPDCEFSKRALLPGPGPAACGASIPTSEGPRSAAMANQIESILLRVFVGEEDSCEGVPLYQAIVAKALELGIAGATVLPCPEGFGRSRKIRTQFNIDGGSRLPMVIEIIDGEEAINAFLPALNQMVESGLVTMERVRAIRYARRPAADWSPPNPSAVS